jgi:hypothetical protein
MPFEVEIAAVKLKKYKLPGSDQIQAGDETLLSEIHILIQSIFGKERVHYSSNL